MTPFTLSRPIWKPFWMQMHFCTFIMYDASCLISLWLIIHHRATMQVLSGLSCKSHRTYEINMRKLESSLERSHHCCFENKCQCDKWWLCWYNLQEYKMNQFLQMPYSKWKTLFLRTIFYMELFSFCCKLNMSDINTLKIRDSGNTDLDKHVPLTDLS